LARHGASLDDYAERETPFLFGIKHSNFGAAEELLRQGANPNLPDEQGYTALHRMLKKGGGKGEIERLMAYGVSGDIPGPDGATARDLMRRKRDPDFKVLAERLG
ncbi:MAG: hypothetical protein JSS35_13220, partial [Proteobacteria bacterium]|nr:hypothetical protein [Pseudomonadota bacterium]